MNDHAGEPQTAVDYIFKHHRNYRHNIEYILIKLARCIDEGNTCPSHRNLAEMTGLSKTTVRAALGELEKDGVITRVKNGGAKVKGGKTDCYAIVGYTPAQPQAELKPAPESVSGATIAPTTVVAQTVVPTTIVTGDTLKHDQPEISPSEYVHADSDVATREQDLSLKAKDRQTDSVKSPELEGDGLTPEERQVRSDFEGIFGPLNPLWWSELKALVGYYSLVFVSVAFSSASLKRDKGEIIDRPMNYLRTTLSNMAAEGKIPHLLPGNPLASKFNPGGRAPAYPVPTPAPTNPAYIPIQDRPRLAAHEVVDLANFVPVVRR